MTLSLRSKKNSLCRKPPAALQGFHIEVTVQNLFTTISPKTFSGHVHNFSHTVPSTVCFCQLKTNPLVGNPRKKHSHQHTSLSDLLSTITKGGGAICQQSAVHGKIALANELKWAPITSTSLPTTKSPVPARGAWAIQPGWRNLEIF